MRCQEARDILNALMDGQLEPRASLAMEHVQDCAECRQWQDETEKAIGALAALKDTTPAIDFSGVIMASLPARHPASCKDASTLVSKKLIFVMAAFWLLGAIMMAGGIGVWAYYFGGSPHSAATHVKASAGTVGYVARSSWSTSGVLFSVAINAFVDILKKETRSIVAFFVADAAILLLLATVWWKRRTLAGPYSILS